MQEKNCSILSDGCLRAAVCSVWKQCSKRRRCAGGSCNTETERAGEQGDRRLLLGDGAHEGSGGGGRGCRPGGLLFYRYGQEERYVTDAPSRLQPMSTEHTVRTSPVAVKRVGSPFLYRVTTLAEATEG